MEATNIPTFGKPNATAAFILRRLYDMAAGSGRDDEGRDGQDILWGAYLQVNDRTDARGPLGKWEQLTILDILRARLAERKASCNGNR